MKKVFAAILLIALILTGCYTGNSMDLISTETFCLDPGPTIFAEADGSQHDQTEEYVDPGDAEASSSKDNLTETTDDAENRTEIPATNHNSSKPENKEDSQPTAPSQAPGDTPVPNTPVPPTQADSVPTVPESPSSDTEKKEPISSPSEPSAGTTGCAHDWKHIAHAEEGYWKAGIVCDCGWTIYGEPSELAAQWNAHSASFSPAESLFDHGGFGCMDEWVVVKPAYDEWVCRHCGEPKE
jgi:hypothetical protein